MKTEAQILAIDANNAAAIARGETLPLPKRIPHKDERGITEREWAWGRCARLRSAMLSYADSVAKAKAAGNEASAKLRQGHYEEAFVELVKLAKEHAFPLSAIPANY